jgi:hypothetical protein
MRHGGNNSGSSVGRRGDDAASRGVFFVHGDGPHIQPVHSAQRIAGLCFFEALRQVGGASLYLETSGSPARLKSAGRAVLHGLPDLAHAVADLLDRPPSHFVGEHDEVNGEALVFADAEQFAGAAERVKKRTVCAGGGRRAFFGDESAANRVVDAGIERLAVGTEGRKAHAIRVPRKQRILIKGKVRGLKRDDVLPEQGEQTRYPDALDKSFDLGRINLVRLLSHESE